MGIRQLQAEPSKQTTYNDIYYVKIIGSFDRYDNVKDVGLKTPLA